MSMMTTSRARARPASTASNATAAGSPPEGAPTKSAPARSAQISSCSSAAARNVSPAPTSTLRPCSWSFWASLPMVVVLPVPLTPTTRITVGFAVEVEPRRGSEELLDLLGERLAEIAHFATQLQAPHELRRRGDADISVDERLLESLPGLLVGSVERAARRSRPSARGGSSPASRGAARRNRSARARPPRSARHRRALPRFSTRAERYRRSRRVRRRRRHARDRAAAAGGRRPRRCRRLPS